MWHKTLYVFLPKTIFSWLALKKAAVLCVLDFRSGVLAVDNRNCILFWKDFYGYFKLMSLVNYAVRNLTRPGKSPITTMLSNTIYISIYIKTITYISHPRIYGIYMSSLKLSIHFIDIHIFVRLHITHHHLL